MKLNYFGYYIKNTKTNKEYLYDIRKLLMVFCDLKSVSFKNSFQHNGENIYLFFVRDDIYLFVMTRSNEVIKKINKNDLNVNEIYDLLEQDEHLGFASYVYFKGDFLGFASTFLAPKISALVSLIDGIFEKIQLGNYKFIVQALLYQASKDEVLKLPFLGRTTIEVEKENSMFKDLLVFASADAEDALEVESFELIIRPKKRKNIQKLIGRFVRSTPEEGLSKLIIKAKDQMQDNLTDLYIVGKGAISEQISSKDENRIYDHIVSKTGVNKILEQKVEEYVNNERFEKTQPKDIDRFINSDAWAYYVHDI